MPENKVTREELDERIKLAPFHQWLGIEVTAVNEDDVEFRVPWREEFFVNKKAGYAHGGILAAIIDSAGDYALAAKLGRPYPTVDMRIDYHRAAVPGDMIIRAKVIKLGKIVSVAEASVFDEEDRLLASGRGVYAVAAPK